ncbi:gypsy retrotransposon integrase-like protein [Pimephales promelas]|nr:gypsy retrotransposon integrase-like protein [Pimephales promelas]
MEDKWEALYNLLSVGSYPSGYDKSKRQNIRRYALKFNLKDGELFYGSKRVIKTKEEARMLFEEFHSSPIGGHTGIGKTRAAICARFYWHGMSVDIENWVLECDQCQKVGKPLTAVQTLQCIKVSAVWELVGIDLTGPLPETAEGFKYILTATDYFSKWVEAFPLKTKTAAEVGRHLCSIIYRHGCPQRILSDQGREFVNDLNHRLCEMLCIKRSVTAAYHPQTNGLDEKTNDNIKRALKKLVNDQQNDWDVYLDATLFSLRSKVHTTTKHSPFLLMYGREAVFPAEIPAEMPLSTISLPVESSFSDYVVSDKKKRDEAKKQTEENIGKSQEKQKEAYAKKVQKKYKDLIYNVGDEVLLMNMRKRGRKGGRIEPDFSGPYIIERLSGKLVTLNKPGGITLKTKYSISHIKPYRRSQTGKVPDDCSVISISGSTESNSSCEMPPCTVAPTLSTPHSVTKCLNHGGHFDLLVTVVKVWAANVTGQVEAVVGPYKLYDSSFHSLQGTQWLADEVIDAYLHLVIKKKQNHIHQLCAVVARSLFAGQFRCLGKMKFPIEDIWLCPVNVGAHWILVIINMPEKNSL